MNGCDSAPQRDSQIFGAMNNIEREANELREIVTQLEASLSSVLRSQTPKEAKGEGLAAETKVDLACRIDEQAGSVRVSRSRLDDILSRLEL